MHIYIFNIIYENVWEYFYEYKECNKNVDKSMKNWKQMIFHINKNFPYLLEI